MDFLPAPGHTFADGEEKSPRVSLDNSNTEHAAGSSAAEDDGSANRRIPSALAAHEGAREIIRLIQCPHCSKPYNVPVTLPCGHSFCRACLPEAQPRGNISYPNTPDRQTGLRCWECLQIHAVGDCNVDVTLSKVMESVSTTVAEDTPNPNCPLIVEELPPLESMPSYNNEQDAHLSSSWELAGGRLIATYRLASEGELKRSSNLKYRSLKSSKKECEQLDIALLNRFRASAYKELDCQVCYSMMLDPVTTPCGHTFCGKCLARVLDHSRQCPFCRRTVPIAPSSAHFVKNTTLCALLSGLCPEMIAGRAEAVALEELGMGGSAIPLFVCTLAFPSMPTFLHVFEPKYRLMLRRALEGNKRFGMVSYNRHHETQGDLGVTHFTQYGTLLEIIGVQYQHDGRCYVETRGVQRFKVTSYSILDGYMVGNVERIDDIALVEEERREAAEIMAFSRIGEDPQSTSPSDNSDSSLDALSTQDLLNRGTQFIESMHRANTAWLNERIVEAYGGPPDDPALFPFWFATVLPIADDEKYVLLHTTSVRERLKIVNSWIRRIQRQRCACTVL